ncbi:hypothetical protein FQR65_LT09523 [Abscondita terminalis]|nr:hypothetical protein FQR65_LT09523 [Abscondita terminalis]
MAEQDHIISVILHFCNTHNITVWQLKNLKSNHPVIHKLSLILFNSDNTHKTLRVVTIIKRNYRKLLNISFHSSPNSKADCSNSNSNKNIIDDTLSNDINLTSEKDQSNIIESITSNTSTSPLNNSLESENYTSDQSFFDKHDATLDVSTISNNIDNDLQKTHYTELDYILPIGAKNSYPKEHLYYQKKIYQKCLILKQNNLKVIFLILYLKKIFN